MADTLIIVSESGKVYKVTLGSSSQPEELKPSDPNAVAATDRAASGAVVAEIDPSAEQKRAASGAKAFEIMCTFVNLPSIGD